MEKSIRNLIVSCICLVLAVFTTATGNCATGVYPTNITIAQVGEIYPFEVMDETGKPVIANVWYSQNGALYGPFSSVIGIYLCDLVGTFQVLENSTVRGTVTVTVGTTLPIGTVFPSNPTVKSPGDVFPMVIKDKAGKAITEGIQYRQGNYVYGTFNSPTGLYTCNLTSTVDVLHHCVKVGTVSVTVSNVTQSSLGYVTPVTISVRPNAEWSFTAIDNGGQPITSGIWYYQNGSYYGPFDNGSGKYKTNLTGSVEILWNLVKIGSIVATVDDSPLVTYAVTPSLAEPNNGAVTFLVKDSKGNLVNAGISVERSYDKKKYVNWTSTNGTYTLAWLQDIDGEATVYVDDVLAGKIVVKPNPTQYVITPSWVAGPTNGIINFSVKTASGTWVLDDVRIIRTIDPEKTYGPWNTTQEAGFNVGWDNSFGSITVYVGLLEAGKIVVGTEKKSVTITSANEVVSVPSYGDYTVYGTSANNIVKVAKGSKVKLINFPGNNKIYLESEASTFKVSRSGATVTFISTDGTKLVIPATSKDQYLYFGGSTSQYKMLVIEGRYVVLNENQVVTTTPASIY